MLAQVRHGSVRVIQQADAGADHFAQVMRRNIRGHAHGDTHGAVEQHVRHAGGQPAGLVHGAVEVRHPIHRALAQFAQQRFGDRAELGLGVAHRREALGIVRRTEVALAIDQRIAIRERLRHQHHRLVARGVAMRMELADDVADGARGLLGLGACGQAQLAHGVDDAPLHRLEPVAHEGQGAVQHHVHRIIEVSPLGIFLERDLFKIGLQIHAVTSMGCALGGALNRAMVPESRGKGRGVCAGRVTCRSAPCARQAYGAGTERSSVWRSVVATIVV